MVALLWISGAFFVRYPRYTREQDQRCKLTDKQVASIQKLYDRGRGVTVSDLARTYGVSWPAVKRLVDPMFRAKQLSYSRAWHANKRKDPAFREKERSRHKKEARRKRQGPEHAEWNREAARKCRAKEQAKKERYAWRCLMCGERFPLRKRKCPKCGSGARQKVDLGVPSPYSMGEVFERAG